MRKRLPVILCVFALIYAVLHTPAMAEGLPQDVLPVVTKHPIEETVEAGGNCSFIVNAENFTKIEWFFHKGNVTIRAEDAERYFPGLKVENADECEIFLLSVPATMNGWTAGATFSNDEGRIKTSYCPLHVIGGTAATPAPTQTPSPTPQNVPVPVETEAVPETSETEEPTETAAPAPIEAEAPASDEGVGHLTALILGGAMLLAVCAAAILLILNANVRRKGRH